jgi:hypothetical protein
MSPVENAKSQAQAQSNDEMIGSLGEALAGVNLGSNSVHNNGFSFHSQPETSGDPFRNNSDWGGYAGRDGSNQSPQDPSTPQRAESNKQSIEMFLTQSPSQLLGNDVFKLSTGHLPGLAMNEDGRSSDQNPFRQGMATAPGRGGSYQDLGRKSESPSNSNSSRSASPYNNPDGGRTINAYHGTAGDMQGSHPQIQSPYKVNPNNPGFSNSYKQPNIKNSPQVVSQTDAMAANPQGQILYMAVPTPDGRGQVLQPVQMVQLSGKPFYQVVPGQGGMPPIQGGMINGQQAPMMVVPPMPMQQGQPSDPSSGVSGGNGLNNGQSKLYATDNNASQFGDMRGPGNDLNNIAASSQYAPAPNPTDNASSLYSTPQRPSLDSLLGQVRRLSRDQVGCRLVQQALDEEGSMAATLILNEGLPFWGEAMVDPFGNYLFQKILEKITAEERVMLVKSVSTRLVNASLNLHGTRSVQKIVDLCSIDEEMAPPKKDDKESESAADILTRSLAPAAARLCIDSHGNHVIQRILLKLGHTHAKFVFDAVAESVGDVARHRHGCCVIQRCLDSPPGPSRAHLVRRIVDKALELMQDAYGNYVVQYVLDVCSDDDVHAVCESVVGKVNLLAIQKFSSNVMEKCLERCTDHVKAHYLAELSDVERVRELMMDPFGNYVVQRALSVATHAQAVRLVESMRPHLLSTVPGTPIGQRNGGVRNTAGGRRIMAKICRRFPNFTLNAPAGTGDEIYSQNKGHHRHQNPNHMMAPVYGGQHSPSPHHHQHYGANQLAMNMGTMAAHQFDQRQPQPHYEIAAPDPSYYQHAPHMGYGAY